MTFPDAETYIVFPPLRRAASEAEPNVRVPDPSVFKTYVAPVRDCVAGAPADRLAACPVTLKSARRPAAAAVRPKKVLRALAAVPPGNSSVAVQYGPASTGAFVGAGMATSRSNVPSADSVDEPSSASGPTRALTFAVNRRGLSMVTMPAASTVYTPFPVSAAA